MKKLLAIVMVLIVCAAAFAGCGKGEAEVKSEPYNVGNFTVNVPSNWKAFVVTDMFAEDPSAANPDAIQICKGGKTEFDLFTKPYVQINFYGPETTLMEPDAEWYDGAVMLDDITTGAYTWKGFTAEGLLGDKMAILWTGEADGVQYQATVYFGTDGTISLDDAGLLAILGSLKAN